MRRRFSACVSQTRIQLSTTPIGEGSTSVHNEGTHFCLSSGLLVLYVSKLSFTQTCTHLFGNLIVDAVPAYDDIGDCHERSRYCGAAFWCEERLTLADIICRVF